MITKEELNNLSIEDFKQYENIDWEHGVADCYSLIIKVYHEMFGIDLNDYERPAYWWAYPERFDLYRQNYEKEGFHKIEISKDNPLQIGDLILMKIGCQVPAHGAIYIGNNMILHHFMRKPSIIEDYKDIWLETTTEVIRHKDLV